MKVVQQPAHSGTNQAPRKSARLRYTSAPVARNTVANLVDLCNSDDDECSDSGALAVGAKRKHAGGNTGTGASKSGTATSSQSSATASALMALREPTDDDGAIDLVSDDEGAPAARNLSGPAPPAEVHASNLPPVPRKPGTAAPRPLPNRTSDGDFEQAVAAMAAGDDADIVDNVLFTRHHLRRLMDGVWVKDEAINMYVSLLLDWVHLDPSLPTCYLPSSFFLDLLWDPHGRGAEKAYDYSRAARWTKRAKINVFNPDGSPGVDVVIIHRNIGNAHWTVIYIDMVNRNIWNLDGFGAAGTEACRQLLRWLVDEATHRHNFDLDTSEWQIRGLPAGLPEQTDKYSCGVFAMAYMYFLVQGKVRTFFVRTCAPRRACPHRHTAPARSRSHQPPAASPRPLADPDRR